VCVLGLVRGEGFFLASLGNVGGCETQQRTKKRQRKRRGRSIYKDCLLVVVLILCVVVLLGPESGLLLLCNRWGFLKAEVRFRNDMFHARLCTLNTQLF